MDRSLDERVEFLIKRLEILQADPPGLRRSYDIDRYLASFCKVIRLIVATEKFVQEMIVTIN